MRRQRWSRRSAAVPTRGYRTPLVHRFLLASVILRCGSLYSARRIGPSGGSRGWALRAVQRSRRQCRDLSARMHDALLRAAGLGAAGSDVAPAELLVVGDLHGDVWIWPVRRAAACSDARLPSPGRPPPARELTLALTPHRPFISHGRCVHLFGRGRPVGAVLIFRARCVALSPVPVKVGRSVAAHALPHLALAQPLAGDPLPPYRSPHPTVDACTATTACPPHKLHSRTRPCERLPGRLRASASRRQTVLQHVALGLLHWVASTGLQHAALLLHWVASTGLQHVALDCNMLHFLEPTPLVGRCLRAAHRADDRLA